ncbi:MAG: DUF1304 domain-containing protein [Leptospirales bacterium]|nr:DUF1304 domain-containing protein [Leptospirales bacterium]
MEIASRIFAALAGFLHIWIFIMESVLWLRPAIHRRFGVTDIKQAELMKNVFYNQGFYNLFLAIGVLYGVFFFNVHPGFAPPIMFYGCLCIVGAGLALLSSRRTMARAAIIQALPPLISVICFILFMRGM